MKNMRNNAIKMSYQQKLKVLLLTTNKYIK